VDVVGWSDGGILGYLLAIEHPRLVRRLVTSGANVDGEGMPPPRSELRPEDLPPFFQEAYAKFSPDFIPQEQAMRLAQAIPGAQLMIVPGTGHGTFLQRPELMNLALLEFRHHLFVSQPEGRLGQCGACRARRQPMRTSQVRGEASTRARASSA
jgi:pimeloyl-ACP methyl ester carboxylesterase